MTQYPRTYTSEVWVTKLKDIFYRPQYQARALYELMAPDLIFDEMWPHIPTPDLAVNIPKKTVSGTRFSDAGDVRKTWAPPWRPGADITVDTVSPGEYESHTLKTFARGFTVDLAAASNPLQMQWIAETRKRIAYWLREQINADVVTAVTNDFSVTNTDVGAWADKMEHVTTDYGYETTIGNLTGVLDAANYWDEAGADPVTDVMDLGVVFGDQDGYPFELTDLYMTKNAANMLSKFVVRSGGTWAKDPTTATGYMTNQVAGVSFHLLKGDTAGWTVTAGDDYIMGLDRNWPAAETYYYTYSKLPTIGGFMNYDFYHDKPSKTDHYEFMFSRTTLLREPRALCVLMVRT